MNHVELSPRRTKSKSGTASSSSSADHDHTPSFLCEGVYLQVDFKKVTDINNLEVGHKGPSSSRESKMPPLYMTRAQLKRHTSSLVNFSIDVHFISQKVNMPLLRLVNQIVTMHQNAKETNEELKEMKPTAAATVAAADTASAASSSDHKPVSALHHEQFLHGHKKSSSGSSTSSNPLETSVDGGDVLQQQNRLMAESSSSSRRNFQTPSPSLVLKSQIMRNRPKSFAQKFRPNSRLAGTTTIAPTSTVGESPLSEQPHDSFILTSAPLEMISEEQTMIRCWKTMYNLLELYSTMPTTKTVQRQSLTPVSNMQVDAGTTAKRAVTPTTTTAVTSRDPAPTAAAAPAPLAKTPEAAEAPPLPPPQPSAPQLPKVNTPGEIGGRKAIKEVSFAKADFAGRHEHTPVIVFGIAKIRRTRLTAVISGLKLEGEIKELQTSMQYREKVRAPLKGNVLIEASVIGNMQETLLSLLEGRKQQTVVRVTVGRTQAIHTSHMWKTKDKNCGTLSVDLVQVEIPQHPVDLHSIVTVTTKELSSTLQEFRGTILQQRGKATTNLPVVPEVPDVPDAGRSPKANNEERVELEEKQQPAAAISPPHPELEEEKSRLIKPFVMQFNLNMKRLVMSAALLPSLDAEYSMENLTSKGMTGEKAKFVIDLPRHTLSFNTKLQRVEEEMDASEANLPSEASIDLPKVQVSAEYIQDDPASAAAAAVGAANPNNPNSSTAANVGSPTTFRGGLPAPGDGSILSQGSYLSAEAEIGELEHSLTTDLLNHLVFVQKVFMKEVNEVKQVS